MAVRRDGLCAQADYFHMMSGRTCNPLADLFCVKAQKPECMLGAIRNGFERLHCKCRCNGRADFILERRLCCQALPLAVSFQSFLNRK